MIKRIDWKKIIYRIGIVALILGVLDPMEGSLIITVGITLIVLSTYLTKDPYRKLFLISMLLIITGVFFLFYFSSRGGFGGDSVLSWWWGLLILPYPIGWIMAIVLLILRARQR